MTWVNLFASSEMPCLKNLCAPLPPGGSMVSTNRSSVNRWLCVCVNDTLHTLQNMCSMYIMHNFKCHVYIARNILIQSYTKKILPFEVQNAELAKNVNVTRNIAKREKSLSIGNSFNSTTKKTTVKSLTNQQWLLLSNMHFELQYHSSISLSRKTRRKYSQWSPHTPSRNLSEGIIGCFTENGIHLILDYMGVSKIGVTPKWMVCNGKPY